MTEKLRAFRPAATVLETQIAPARRGEGAGALAGPGFAANTGPDAFLTVMRLKRSTHDGTIQAYTALVNLSLERSPACSRYFILQLVHICVGILAAP